ncbi:hypothetical protein [Streptomyces cupreus]|uniref:Uncharacterized protein n=1 Tax=Streptomyces cupreus TaxID=2759956 RepID=A0A7X1JBS8_9ACTN|nr:hypothetical protein [Streptomyces cupreus]MBC2907859.1 hypothetical protein [Streptomyces cupreus]
MPEISRVGAVSIERGHFPVGEMWEPGFERREDEPEFGTEEPVIVVPGQIVVTSRVQDHVAPVVLAVNDQEGEAPGPAWTLVASVEYQPVYMGRMAALDTMNGPAGPADGSIEVFGQPVQPGEPSVELDPSRTYRAHVWSQGRSDSRERFDAAMQREEWGTRDGFETYLVVFVPEGSQEAPIPAAGESRRDRLARRHGKPPLNMR